MAINGVKRFIFSFIAANFGEPEGVPMDEINGKYPVDSYAKSKCVVEQVPGELRPGWKSKSVHFDNNKLSAHQTRRIA
jgi:UDP-glucose 4-epimerase